MPYNPSLFDNALHLQLGLDYFLLGHNEIGHQPLIYFPKENVVLLQVAHNTDLNEGDVDDYLEDDQTRTNNDEIGFHWGNLVEETAAPLLHHKLKVNVGYLEALLELLALVGFNLIGAAIQV